MLRPVLGVRWKPTKQSRRHCRVGRKLAVLLVVVARNVANHGLVALLGVQSHHCGRCRLTSLGCGHCCGQDVVRVVRRAYGHLMMVVLVVVVMVGLLLLLSLLQGGGGRDCIVVARAVVRVIDALAGRHLGAQRHRAALVVGGPFRLVAVVLEPVRLVGCQMVIVLVGIRIN